MTPDKELTSGVDAGAKRGKWHRVFKVNARNAALVLAALVVLALLGDLYVGSKGSEVFHQDLRKVPQTDAALVLGTAKYAQGGRPNLFYMPRLEAAATLYAAGKVRGIVVSGDNATMSYNEPQRMKKDLIKLGVPPEHITCDYAGLRTLDSVVRMSRVFGIERYTVVSQPFHVKRALYIANAHGHEAVGYGARDVPRGYGSKVRLRETFARLMAFIDVNLLGTKPKFLGDPVRVGLLGDEAGVTEDNEPVGEPVAAEDLEEPLPEGERKSEEKK